MGRAVLTAADQAAVKKDSAMNVRKLRLALALAAGFLPAAALAQQAHCPL